MPDKMKIDEEELKKKLTPEQYHLLREKGTEAPYSSELLDVKTGMFACAVCGKQLFSSDAKLDHTLNSPGLQGWPSFEEALPGAVEFKKDDSYGMERTEVICANCGSHLGHVFDGDAQAKTGKHFCINGACLLHKPE